MIKMLLLFSALFYCYSLQASERLVVAGGSLVELVYSLGAGEQLVGVDKTTTWPPESQSLPHISHWKQLSSEGILSLEPDLFISWQDAEPQLAIRQLREQKVEVLLLPRVPATVEQMYCNISLLAHKLNLDDKGESLPGAIRKRLEKVAQSTAAKKRPVTAMFILSAGGSSPQIAGKGSVADAIMTLAGARNVAHHSQYGSYSAEALIAANPDVLIVTTQMINGDLSRLKSVNGIAQTTAWKNQRIISVDQSLILGMGPRVAEVVELLHGEFWPQNLSGTR